MSSPSVGPTWYINGIPVFRLDPTPEKVEWQDESIGVIVHYKGSNSGAYHANGFAPATLAADVRVRVSDHAALKALRQTSVLCIDVASDDQRTATLMEYQARRVDTDTGCWYQGTMSLVDV